MIISGEDMNLKKGLKKRKFNWINFILLLIIIICLTFLIISVKDIIVWKLDSKKIEKQVKEIQEIVKIEEVVEDLESKIEIIEPDSEIPKSSPYWDYLKMNLIYVDFSELININSDTKGWIQVNGTSINYPFVQAKDNKYYLTHSFDKTYNNAGWVFLDYRNKINSLNKNTIIYAHGRLDTTMFGSLKNILKSDWLNDSNNYIVKLSTEKENTLWQVFSVYHIPTTSDYIKTEFDSDEEFTNWTKMSIQKLVKTIMY